MKMETLITAINTNPYHFTALFLFLLGFHTLLTHTNVIKKIIGLNIMETGVFLFFVASGYIRDSIVPIITGNDYVIYSNPVPSALILTGIVIALSITALSLGLIVRLYNCYGTLDATKMAAMRGKAND